nr:hypothetical protein [Streptomyces polyasparticus]
MVGDLGIEDLRTGDVGQGRHDPLVVLQPVVDAVPAAPLWILRSVHRPVRGRFAGLAVLEELPELLFPGLQTRQHLLEGAVAAARRRDAGHPGRRFVGVQEAQVGVHDAHAGTRALEERPSGQRCAGFRTLTVISVDRRRAH